jgi:23S rRNA pseudouridine2605 synthase
LAEERLQKVLARAGIASRRAAEELITARRVRVDGRIVSELGTRVDSRARIEVDGRVVVAEPLVYVVLHKPRGVVCTLKDPEGRPTVAEYLKDVGARVVPVGRLDFHTSGALICTNDGETASKLMHPRHHAEKEYVAKVSGVVDERTLDKLRERIVIDGRATQPAEVRLLRVEEGKSWLGVKLGEGRNRQVRRLGEHAGVPVMRLVRVGHAGITAEGLRPGEWRRLTLDELKDLKKQYGVPRRIHALDPNLDQARGGRVTLRQPRNDGRRTGEQGRSAGRGRDERAYGEERSRGERRFQADGRAPERGRTAASPGERRRPSEGRDRGATRPDQDARPRRSAGPRDERPRGGAREYGDERPRGGAREYGDARPRGGAREYGDARPRGPSRAEAHTAPRGTGRAREAVRPRAEQREASGTRRDATRRDGAGPHRDGAGPRRGGRSRR